MKSHVRWSGHDKEQPPAEQELQSSPVIKANEPLQRCTPKTPQSAVPPLHTQHSKPASSCAARALLLPTAAFRINFSGQESRAAAKGSLPEHKANN